MLFDGVASIFFGVHLFRKYIFSVKYVVAVTLTNVSIQPDNTCKLWFQSAFQTSGLEDAP